MVKATGREGHFRRPTVSVCIPAFNAQETLPQTLESVWCQTFEDFEVVVVDDCSRDATAEILAAQSDRRLRVLRNPRNLRAPASSNRALQHARGSLIKFLDADDMLQADCLARMVGLVDSEPSLGMVFCRRLVWLVDPADEYARLWKEKYDDVSAQFGTLRAVNDGRDLFARWVGGGFQENWVGEPAVVMLSRDLLERAGAFNPNIRQRFDFDLWARVMPLCAVGFIPEQLATYRKAASSLSVNNDALSLDWLDRLWTFEGLGCRTEPWVAAPGLARLHEEESRWVRYQLGELVRARAPGWQMRLTDAGRMAAWRMRKRVQPGAVPFARIGPPLDPSDAPPLG